VLVALLLFACGAETQPGPRKPPKAIVMISLDTLRADYLGLYQYRAHPTSPKLDAFAEESVVFDASMVSEP